MKVGTATLKLNKFGRDNAKGKAAKKGQKKGKKSGKTRAVVGEAMEERRGKDVANGGSIDHARSHLNEYWVCDEIVEWADARDVSPTSADTIVDWCEERIEEYSETVFRPKVGRGVAEDAVQMLGLIVKPEARIIAGWSPERTTRFFQLSGDYLDGAFGGRRNLVAVARHFDEGFEDMSTSVFYDGEHEHRFYMPWTEDGRLCAKEVHGTSLWKKLNKGYAEFMRANGFPEIEDTEILDYEQVVRLDDEIAKAEAAGDEDTAQAKRAEKDAMRAEAYETRRQHLQERDGLAPGAPAAAYRGMREAQAIRDEATREAADMKHMTDEMIDLHQKFVGEDTFEFEGETVIGLSGAITMRDEAMAAAEAAERAAERAVEDTWPDMADARQMVDEAVFESEVVAREAAVEVDAIRGAAEVDAACIRTRAKRKVDAAKVSIAEGERTLEIRRQVLEREFDERARSLDAYADRLADVEQDDFFNYVVDVTSSEDNMRIMFSAKSDDGRSVEDDIADEEPDTRKRGGLRMKLMNMAARFIAVVAQRWQRDRWHAIENARQEYREGQQSKVDGIIGRYGDDASRQRGVESLE